MSKIIQIVGEANGRPTEHDGRYLSSCDVDARKGRGVVHSVKSPDEARLFADTADALLYWKRQSSVTPLRDDGKPNRPLTAYTIEVLDGPPIH